ncbi:hypothetical protein PR048_011411 [Dryococelus australis]|uniref:DDE-1 domain-containing protein n=1 Tax=Dryococelus australis TaxID=614101 RepID=A0ABQ9HLN3_9NEOP|nr:hypothetical protein PR048_011411 [Dryococelus australis]
MSQSRAWVTKEVVYDWYTNNFVPQVKQHYNEIKLTVKDLILLDNAPGHPDKEELILKTADGYVEALYFAENTTTLIQPMDQNVIETLKARYKKHLLTDIVSQPNADITSLLRQFNIKDAIVNAAFAWRQVRFLTLIKSWENIWPENPLLPKKDGNKNKSQDNNNDFAMKLKFYKNLWKIFVELVLDDNLNADLLDEEIIKAITEPVDDMMQEASEARFTVNYDEAVSAANT